MNPAAPPRRRAPRLVVKVLGFSFLVITAVLVAVFVVLSWQTRERLTRAVVANLEASQRRFADMALRRQRELRLQAVTLAENPTLKAAVDTYYAEATLGTPPLQLVRTIQLELDKLQDMLGVPALSVSDVRGVILASAGPLAPAWPPGDRLSAAVRSGYAPFEAIVSRGDRTYLTTVVALRLGEDLIGQFFLASPLDDAYARELSGEAGADVAIFVAGRVVATTAPANVIRALEQTTLPANGSVVLAGDEYVVGRLWAVDRATVYALASVTAALRAAMSEAAWLLFTIGCGALLLAALASWWLARALGSPIQQLTRTLAQMTRERDFERPLHATRVSRELDDLVETFDALRTAVIAAEADSEAAYVGVIGSLAAALDARDPYTAGHSERVAGLSVAIATELGLSDLDVETVRLGALLHDIGKIGVSDEVLRKPGPLVAEEFDQIRRHPALGARILKPLRFLEAQLPVVELHHEQPDGRGYPHGLKGQDVPLLAGIVHVADAFDAMTSARAYRRSRSLDDAVSELWRHAGTQFAPEIVAALASLPVAVLVKSQEAAANASLADEGASVRGALIQFRGRTVSARGTRAAG